MLTVGDKAPDFKLTTLTADGPAFTTLSENAGKSNTLVLFFPMAFTGVCTQEFCDLTATLNDYTSLMLRSSESAVTIRSRRQPGLKRRISR